MGPSVSKNPITISFSEGEGKTVIVANYITDPPKLAFIISPFIKDGWDNKPYFRAGSYPIKNVRGIVKIPPNFIDEGDFRITRWGFTEDLVGVLTISSYTAFS